MDETVELTDLEKTVEFFTTKRQVRDDDEGVCLCCRKATQWIEDDGYGICEECLMS